MAQLRYMMPLTHEQLEARKTMPTDTHGYVIGLPWVVDKYVRAYEVLWREWLSKHPKHLWPDWVDTWADDKRRRGL